MADADYTAAIELASKLGYIEAVKFVRDQLGLTVNEARAFVENKCQVKPRP